MSLHLAKIEIDYETAHKAGLRDTYAWHQWAWSAFPGRPDAERDFLTRLDETDGGFRFLIQSAHPAARPQLCPLDSWETKKIPEPFFAHPRYRFSLLANPTKKVRSNAKGELLRNSRRVPLVSREDLVAWLERKGAAHGFRIDSATLKTIPRSRQLFTKKSRADEARRTGLHSATEFAGTIEVTDT